MSEFKLGEKSYKFNSNGDINLGYDIVMWRSEGGKIYVHDTVAEYHPLYNNITYMDQQKPEMRQLLEDLKVGSNPHAPSVTLMFTFKLLKTKTACSVSKGVVSASSWTPEDPALLKRSCNIWK